MSHTYVSVDFYNNSAACKINGVVRVFSSVEAFKYGTGFPYSQDVRLFAYEPDRNIYVVESANGKIETGAHLHTMVWVAENLSKIEQAVILDEQEHPANPEPTLVETRNIKLAMTDWVLIRKNEEDLLNIPNSMTAEKFAAVLTYRQALRDITKTYSDIKTVVWPIDPLS
jgi:hypothetical protein